ncbi:hypothetical protein GALMADRAFT_225633 [Galerina marginata CBS 339.88]|uniref:Protein kinase domain-containing protein n=1 Tax=Galerina marginata (strain CBS 339.88) TaxID=685588 RepID=A0A067T9T5_GALM3|nr:hypothetical protein GALMADRAFT_225633 [Galerina marginata CBS 339.88]
MVHGDIRSNNVMIKMKDLLHVEDDPDVQLKLVDFDWADEELLAFYPAFVNTKIPWSGRPGSKILFPHDAELVGKWLAKYPTSIRF